MSIGLNTSHQHVGHNRVGKYFKTVPEKGPEVSSGLRAPTTNEPWRRWNRFLTAGRRVNLRSRRG